MTTVRPFKLTDLFQFNNVNLDPLTETVRAAWRCGSAGCEHRRAHSSRAPRSAHAQYNMVFYMQYLAKWPNYFIATRAPGSKRLTGYGKTRLFSKPRAVPQFHPRAQSPSRADPNTRPHFPCSVMGKAEGKGENWHGHVTAVTVSPDYRRLGYAQNLMRWLENVSERAYNAYFVDLYVRYSNDVAVGMYKKLGYSIYRQVIGYYSGEEDAYDMRKALPRDVEKKSIIPLPHPVHPGEDD